MILQLQRELEGQKAIRAALEMALNGYTQSDDSACKSLSKSAEDLINEIGRLELEVLCLEKYILSIHTVKRASRSHSQNLAPSFRGAADPFHSLPLSMLERMDTFSGDCDPTPNWISEEMIKCISAVYYQLSDSPCCKPFFPTVEIRGLLRDSTNTMVDSMLHYYRSLISKLTRVDPRRLKHEEKLAFWINVHNSLVMHGFLVYGIPRGHLKRTSIALKAAYNIGGLTVSVETIQNSILRCRIPRPAPPVSLQWLHMLLPRKTKFKAGIPIKLYGIKHHEPRLRFALSSGFESDPPIREYTAKKVMEELEMAKEEYIQMNVKLHKEERVSVPRNVEYFKKESELYNSSAIAEDIFLALPSSWRKKMDKGKLWQRIDWIPHDFSFCVLLSNQLACIGPCKDYKWAAPF